ncbi:MAG: RnfABCDGE type electron transport complex subunit D [Gammaproteobacteria bacterium]|nr:RnfABCDGE type electron transport complex subunit D [Gammaproteobacteria bacterium]
MATKKPIEIRTSPHLKKAISVDQIMRNVVYAMLPVCGWAIFQFGISSLALMITTVLVAMLTESFFCWMSDRPNSVKDASVIITGLLLALTLPPGFPLWMAAVAAFIAVGLGKSLFGGLGYNVMNPALVGRAFVQAAFPVAITTWTPGFAPGRFVEFIPSTFTLPFMTPPDISEWSMNRAIDGFTGATPLAIQKFDHVTADTWDLLYGSTAGSLGETSAIIILLGGAYLAFRKMLDWHIPVAVFAGVIITTLPFFLWNPETYPTPQFMLLSGGLMLGAVFMATDMVGSPLTPRGIWLYGLFIGSLTVIIRLFGGLTEGVMYAILLANVLSPLLASITQPRIYGEQKPSKKAEEGES